MAAKTANRTKTRLKMKLMGINRAATKTWAFKTPEKPMDTDIIWLLKMISKKSSFFFGLWIYLFLNLPVAFNKN
jgi:hypothetical protein